MKSDCSDSTPPCLPIVPCYFVLFLYIFLSNPMRITLIISFIGIFLINSSCRKPSKDDLTQEVQAVKRPLGKPKGTITTKTIGPEGGSIYTADKKLQLIVPPGAVAAPVNFSIQPVENTLTGTNRQSYRLLPENVSFSKSITLVFTYDNADLADTRADLLRLAYQDKEGYFHLVTNTEYDETKETLSAQTTHFSDWTYVPLLQLISDKGNVKMGDDAQIKLMYYETLGGLLDKDPPIGGYVDYYIKAVIPRIKWKLSVGAGTIAANGTSCTYTAPSAMPSTNPALISAEVPFWNSTKKDYSRLAILTIPITIADDEFMTYTLDGVVHTNETEDCANGGCIEMEANNFYISAHMKGGQSILIRLLGDSFGTRSYPYGLKVDQAYITLGGNWEYEWWSSMFPCPACEEHHSSGSVKLTKYETIGGYVEGNFTAELWYQNGSYSPEKKEITGQFRIKRKI